jgi:hypothetical protein
MHTSVGRGATSSGPRAVMADDLRTNGGGVNSASLQLGVVRPVRKSASKGVNTDERAGRLGDSEQRWGAQACMGIFGHSHRPLPLLILSLSRSHPVSPRDHSSSPSHLRRIGDFYLRSRTPTSAPPPLHLTSSSSTPPRSPHAATHPAARKLATQLLLLLQRSAPTRSPAPASPSPHSPLCYQQLALSMVEKAVTCDQCRTRKVSYLDLTSKRHGRVGGHWLGADGRYAATPPRGRAGTARDAARPVRSSTRRRSRGGRGRECQA